MDADRNRKPIVESASEPAEVASTPTFSRVSPLDGSPLPPVEASSSAEVAETVTRARTAQRAWANTPLDERIEALERARLRLLERGPELARLLHREIGRPEDEALLGEVLPSNDVFHFWSEAITAALVPSDVTLDALAFPGKSGRIYREPRGVIALIAPWNMPLALPLRTIVPSLLAGNAVVLKPSEVSPRTARALADLFEGVLPDGLLGLVQGGRSVGEELVDAEVDLVVFTGSVSAGRAVARGCAEKLIPCSLELGGKDAAIVLADADLERTAQGIVWGAFTMTGQNCASIERVYVERSIADALTEKLVQVARGLSDSDVGPLATLAQRATVARHVDEARRAGARVLTGGEPPSGETNFRYPPTVLVVESDALEIMQEESFGPVLPVAVVADLDEAIRRANASRFGLTVSLWTRDIARAERAAKLVRAGVVTINNHGFTGALPQAPWCGVGDSGTGITNSILALEALTRPRFVLVDRNRAKRELWWYPYTPALRRIALAFVTLRSGASLGRKLRALVELVPALVRRLTRA